MMTQSDFFPVLAEKLKTLGVDYNQDLSKDSAFLEKAKSYFKLVFSRKTKGNKVAYVNEYDFRSIMTMDTDELDRLVNRYDMTAYKAEMYEVIFHHTLMALLSSGYIKLSDNSRTRGPGRVFIKGDK
jgi:hypothetical protein